MQTRASVGDGFCVSVAGTPSTTSTGGSEHDDSESQQGDIYIWGEVLSDGRVGTPNGNCSKIDVLVPKLLESNLILDIHHITSGANHILIITRKGELFTWGEEFGGKLGHRIDKDYSGQLHLVESLEVPNSFVHAACGEYHICAISNSNDFFTWGDGTYSAELLGDGCDTSHSMLRRIEGPLEGLQVVSISCGTWHSALTTSDGKLFTFGDGAFGVLGHGDQESVMYPKEVQLLSGLKAIMVACGVWHTAAIIEVMYQSGGSNVLPWKLFTWGDGRKYQLGHGNNEACFQPTRVASLIEYNFHQVACGHTMTVALTTSGHVFTMGDTEFGQLGNPVSGGKVPTLVQNKLIGEIVEEISCGANHVAALTSKNELYTWGRGANGRLGHGDLEDKKSPTLVLALKDRHVKNISCGSNFTSCICIHKLVPVSDQTVCSSCRQAFGFMTKKHNCNNCGLAFCHPCSSKKALNAALSSTPDKPHRVCGNCYVKLIKVLEASNSSSNSSRTSRFSRKVTPAHTEGVSRSSSRTLLCPTTKPMNYLEIKSNKSGSSYGSTSIVRASQVPSLVQLKDIEFPSSLSAVQCAMKPLIPQTTPQTMSSNLRSTSPITRRPSPPRSISPRFSGNYVDTLRKTSERLNQEISKMQNQIQSLKLRSDTLEMENQRLHKNATEASAIAAVEFSHLVIAKEFIESAKNQLKKMTEKFPQETQDSEILRTIQTQAEDVLKEISESETPCSPPKFEPEEMHTGTARHGSNSDTSRLLKHKVEENSAFSSVDPSQAEENALQESNEVKLDSEEHHNEPYIIPEDVDAAQIDHLQRVDGNFHHEISNGSKLEAEQPNSLEENADTEQVDPLQDFGNSLQENNGSNLEPDITTKPQGKVQNEDAKTHVGAGNSALQDCKGKSVSTNGMTVPQKGVEYGSRSLDCSRSGKQGETQVIEQFEPGVFVTLVLRPDGTRVFKRVKFSKRRFNKSEAEEWWNQHKIRVLRQYHQSLQKQTPGSSNISSPPQANEHIEISSPSTTT